MFLKSELLESNGSSVTLFQLSALQRIEYLEYPSFGFAENTDDLFVGKTLLHGDVLMWLMKTLLTSGCTNQRGAGQPWFICLF